MSEKPEASGQSVGTRWPELIVAAVLMVLAALVIVDSLRVGIGWAEDGPRSGYFPFYIGVLLLLSSGSVLIGQLLKWRRGGPGLCSRGQIRFGSRGAGAVGACVGLDSGLRRQPAGVAGWEQ